MNFLFYYFLAVNSIAFILIGYDKYLAKKRRYRIPERTLLLFVLAGGTIASGISMLLFRHKTSKRSYLIRFFTIVFFQLVLLFLATYYKLLGF